MEYRDQSAMQSQQSDSYEPMVGLPTRSMQLFPLSQCSDAGTGTQLSQDSEYCTPVDQPLSLSGLRPPDAPSPVRKRARQTRAVEELAASLSRMAPDEAPKSRLVRTVSLDSYRCVVCNLASLACARMNVSRGSP